MSQMRYVHEDKAAFTFQIRREALVSPEVLERERRAIFDRCWIYVGHGSEIPAVGDYKSRQVAGRPLIFCRDEAGAVRALLNSCRHRGAVVCTQPEGNAKRFFCLYHGWTYGNDGSLKSVPGEEAYGPHFDKGQLGLLPVPRLECYRDFWFVNFDKAAMDLVDYLAGTTEYIDLVTDQSPSGRMQIIAGSQEYDIRANWKLLVENSVDDYHLPTAHATWLAYMRNSGVDVRPAKEAGALLPAKGIGKDLGNGHLVIDNPNYRGRPVAAWISIYGEEAKPDIAGIRAELVARLGEARAKRVADTNRNLVIFPNLVINDGSSVTVRTFFPQAPDRMQVRSQALGPAEETEAQRARRLDAFLTFYGPGGFATPDDIAALELVQQGCATWREIPWSDLSRGMHRDSNHLDTDEEHIRVFWRRWSEMVEASA
jgi:p-cumate 2,3-dioxygenase alpha subunit